MTRIFSVHPYTAGKRKYDVFIAAVGFEARAVHVAQSVEIHAERRIAIGFKDRHTLNYSANKNWFHQNGFEYLELDDNEFRTTLLNVLSELSRDTDHRPTLAIDISCFNRYRLATMVDLVSTAKIHATHINVDFLYVIGAFSPPSTHSFPNTFVGPISRQFAGWTVDPALPPAAVIGLGYEQDKALGAVDHLQITHVLAFIPESTVPEYFPAVKSANASLLGTLKKTNVFNYQVDDPVSCFYTLESIINGLSAAYNPILLPFGPKIFTICALLAATKHPNAAVWRVSGGELEKPSDRAASNHIVGLTVCFQEDEQTLSKM